MTASASRPPRLAMTLGDVRGIGPELVSAMQRDAEVQAACDLLIIGPRGTEVDVHESVGEWTPGASAAHAGRLAGDAVVRAVELARSGAVRGIVTAPLDKHALLLGGFDAPGHTELLSELTGAPTAMMLAAGPLRVVLATTHLPLRDVPAALTADALTTAVTLTRHGLRHWFDIAEPRIALCAMNPHAGDGGRFGDEDDVLLAPVAREAGALGPFPADTVFVRALRGEFDAVIAPYHDVGMTAIKVAAFGRGVNVTLGMPFPRTSPDHGTAMDIAGLGRADTGSMREATLLCARLAQHRSHGA
jgi:4-hydroxythreonine-4-phosphate dehydrogenase